MSTQSVGYVRVSSIDQNPDRQLADISLDRKFIEKVSGAVKERKVLNECIEYVRQGDTLWVDSIDRLARNLSDLQSIIVTLVNKGVIVKFVKENLTFTDKEDPLANLTLQMMGAFAEFERTMIMRRQQEGLQQAKASGKHLGRPFKITKEEIDKMRDLYNDGMSIRQISFKMNVSRASITRLLCLAPVKKIYPIAPKEINHHPDRLKLSKAK